MLSRRLFLLASLSVGLAGCSSDSGYFAPAASQDAAKLSPEAAKAVAVDMAGKFAERVDPKSGAVVLAVDDSPFATAFESALRGYGYGISSTKDQPSGGIPVAYTVADVNGAILVRLTTPQIELSRTYAISSAGASPVSPLNVLQYVKEG